jgi:nitrite reductase/ring-hydroxylating ferredoxin subunit
MQNFVKVARVDEFQKKNYVCISYRSKWIAVIKARDGSFYAIEANCKHQNANLLSNGLRGDIVTCPRHGWKYNMRSGECLTESWAYLRKHPLKIVDNVIYVDTHAQDETKDEWDSDETKV